MLSLGSVRKQAKAAKQAKATADKQLKPLSGNGQVSADDVGAITPPNDSAFKSTMNNQCQVVMDSASDDNNGFLMSAEADAEVVNSEAKTTSESE